MDRARRLYRDEDCFTVDLCKSKRVGYKVKKTNLQICERTKRVCARDAEKNKCNELNKLPAG
jgi:hypothetical protein